MSQNIQTAKLILQIDAGEEVDTDTLDCLTRELRRELYELDVESAELVKEGSIPDGAKPGDPVTIGAIALIVLPALIPNIAELLQAWTRREQNRKVRIKAKVGDRELEVEISPKLFSKGKLMDLVGTLTEALGQIPQASP